MKQWKDNFFIMKYSWLKDNLNIVKYRILLEIIFLSAFSFIPVISAKLSQYAIDKIILEGNLHNLYHFLICCLLFLIIILGLRYYASWVCALTRQSFILGLRKKVWKNIVCNLNFVSNPILRSGDIVSRFTSDVGSIGELAISYIVICVVSFFSFFLYVVILLKSNLYLALITLAFIPGYLVLYLIFKQKIFEASQDARIAYDNTLSFLVHRCEQLEEIKILKGENREIDLFAQVLQKHYQASLKALFLNNFSSAVVDVFGTGWNLTLFGVGAFFVIRSQISLGELIAFLAIAGQLFGPVKQFLGMNMSFQTAEVSLKRVDQFFHVQTSDVRESPFSTRINQGEVWDIKFNDVIPYPRKEGFLSFPFNQRFLLDDRLYLVGKNGVGKSSICKILAGLHVPFKGTISINGIDLTDRNRVYFASEVLLLTHSPYFFYGSIRDNLLYGLQGNYDDAEILSALKKVFLLPWLASYPRGLDAVLNQNASDLSRGQRLRLHCARALLAKPELIILDEVVLGIEEQYQVAIVDAVTQGRKAIITSTNASSIPVGYNVISIGPVEV